MKRHLCYNCFREKPEGEGACPFCGFDLEENIEKYPIALRAGTVLNDRYIIGRVLGQGGFGITYLAFDRKLEAKVAVKEFMPGELATRVEGTTVSVMAATRSEDFVYGAERFQEEARTLAKFIGQPGIAGVSDYFDENNTSYFVMDYIEGISFKTYIANRGGKISVGEALNVIIPVLRALTAVHAEGVIHRDVTPDNIYITKDGNVKLLDFGSARYSIGDKSKSLDVILKVGYAPKEQYIRRGRQGPYTDVYSCAACLYAALTGYLPPESLERLDQDTLVPPSQAGVELPLYLERAILKGLAVQPENRFQSAAEFLQAIEEQQVVEVSGGEQNLAEREGDAQTAQQTGTQRKRLSLFLTLGGALVMAVILFTAGFLIRGRGEAESPTAGMPTGGGDVVENLAVVDDSFPQVTIAGEEYSVYLTSLELEDRNVTNEDLVQIAKLTELRELSIDNAPQVTDLSPLSEMTQLKQLELFHTGAVDLGPLASLTELRDLRLASSEISDLSPLAGLTQLTTLYLDDGNTVSNQMEDLSALAGLVNLEILKLPPQPVYKDFSSLAGMTRLKELRMMGTVSNGTNSVDSLEFLSGMTELERIRLTVRSGDLTPIAGLTKLKEIDIHGDLYAADTSIFRNLTSLESLVLYMEKHSFTVPGDMQDFSGMTQLRRLHISLSGLQSCQGMEGLTELNRLELYLERSQSVDIEALRNLMNLQSVSLSPSGAFRDLSPIDHVPEKDID